MTRGDHDTDPLSIKLLRAEACEQSHCKYNSVKQITVYPYGQQVSASIAGGRSTPKAGSIQRRLTLTLSCETTGYLGSAQVWFCILVLFTYSCSTIFKHLPLWLHILQSGFRDSLSNFRGRHCGVGIGDVKVTFLSIDREEFRRSETREKRGGGKDGDLKKEWHRAWNGVRHRGHVTGARATRSVDEGGEDCIPAAERTGLHCSSSSIHSAPGESLLTPTGPSVRSDRGRILGHKLIAAISKLNLYRYRTNCMSDNDIWTLFAHQCSAQQIGYHTPLAENC